MGGILLLNLNMRLRPIEKKYCEGTLKRISKEKSKEHEMERREQNESGRVNKSSLRSFFSSLNELRKWN